MALSKEARERIPTEKGRLYSLQLIQDERHRCLKTLAVLSNELHKSLSELKDIETIKLTYTNWLAEYDKTLEVHDRVQRLIPDENERQIDGAWFNDKVNKCNELNTMVQQYFSLHQATKLPATTEHYDIKSNISGVSHRSNGSRKSQRSSVSSNLSVARLKEEQRKAELLARSKSRAEKKLLEEEKLKLRMKEEELEIRTEINVSDAKCKVIEVLERSMLADQEIEDELRNDKTPKIQTLTLNPNVLEWVPIELKQSHNVVKAKTPIQTEASRPDDELNMFTDTNNNQHLTDKEKVFSTSHGHESFNLSIAKQLNKPKAEIKIFDGNPMNFKSFQSQFEARIVTNCDSYDEMLNYLLQFTSGEPHRIACGFSHLNSKSGYEATWSEFSERYGDSDVIAHAYVKRAISWPTIKPDNPKALDEFSIFLRECQYAVENVEAARVLEYSENLKHLVQKLPFYMHEKWRNIVYDTKDKKQIVSFSQLVEFVRKEAKKVNDPVYGKDVLGTMNKRSEMKAIPSVTKGFRKNFSISASENDCEQKSNPAFTSNKGSASRKPCLFCNGKSHTLDVCRTIMKKDLKDRYQFLKIKGLCFGCLKAGHQKSNCQHKATCIHCSKIHPSILHVDPRQGDRPNIDESEKVLSPITATSTATNAHMGAGVPTFVSQALPIVPVRLKSINSDKYVETYAFLDGGSTSTFCTDNVLRKLNVEGKKTKINLLTMGQERVVDSFVASDLEICDLNGKNSISLPPIFTRPSLPISKKDVVTKHDLQKWQHLQVVPLERIDADVDLLIGINVPRAMEPWDVIASIGNSPFAVKTLLGWVINGPLFNECVNQTSMFSSSSCNRIAASPLLPSLSDQLRHYFNHDFSESTIDDNQELSMEDKHFLDIASKTIHLQNGHYVMDLPFRSENTEMPNNRKQAEQRLVSLSKRFQADSEFRDQYTLFMNKVIDEGHATVVRKSDLLLENGRIWYLPHHGVYHPQKRKLRVVFDCAARYAGMSLNDKLLQGPNLTNTLIGTLIRFRKDEVAFMGDIDGMFHQVRVSDKDTDFLRFLWWENGDCSKAPIEYKMTVHLFGATSSPSCANYALRRTATDMKGHFCDEVVNTVLNNFYVDDCLKSVASESEAIRLINDLQALLSQGGFNISKWISNSRNVIRSVPIEARAREVMDLDLDKDDLPIDRALGVRWCVDSDEFGFRVDRRDKSITRRGWDDSIPQLQSEKWIEWLNDLEKLSEFRIKRCLKPTDFGNVAYAELHHFADASEIGYGSVTYLRMENESGAIHCSFLIGKSRVTPLKQITIPRLELTAATVAVKTNKMILDELEIPIRQSYYWTDSMAVLRYIRNTTSRFHTFVANRLALIHEGSNTSDWYYISAKLNPADIASRGISAGDLVKGNKWISPPEFLWRPKTFWPFVENFNSDHDDSELEVKSRCESSCCYK